MIKPFPTVSYHLLLLLNKLWLTHRLVAKDHYSLSRRYWARRFKCWRSSSLWISIF